MEVVVRKWRGWERILVVGDGNGLAEWPKRETRKNTEKNPYVFM